jgi:cell division protein FtsB
MKTKRGGVQKAAPGGAKRSRAATQPTAKNKRVRGEVAPRRRPGDAPPRERDRRPGTARVGGSTREQRHGPARAPLARPARPKNTSQAKARAKARKAKAPKVVRPPLRERLITRLAQIEFNPRTLLARVPFVVLVIAALGLGLGVTLWLSTDAAERSYQLGHARKVNEALQQQKESLERQVLEEQAAPALAESARNLGMIPSRDTAHLIQDGAGNWQVVGTPKPAEGVPPPPLNVKLGMDRVPAAPPPPPPAPPAAPPAALPAPPAVPAGQPLPATVPNAGVESPVRIPDPANGLDHAAAGSVTPPMGGPVTGPAPGPIQGPAPGPALAPGPVLQGPAPGPVLEAPAPALAVTPPAPPVAQPSAPAPAQAPVPAPGAPA